MHKGKNWNKKLMMVVMLIVIAILARIGSHYDIAPLALDILRSGIYIGLMLAWGISIQRRVVHVQVRQYLTGISVLIIFWLVIRTVKYIFVTDVTGMRYLWYGYYIPMLLIPCMLWSLAISLGKTECFRMPMVGKVIYIPTFLLLLFVLSNDLHQRVFAFPEGKEWSDTEYTYRWGYYMVLFWILVCVMTALLIMIRKCRIPHSRKRIWLPLIPFGVMIIYSVLYVLQVSWLWMIAGDMTVVQCVVTVAALEACMECGLIQTNSHYIELFRHAGLQARIVDSQYEVQLESLMSECLDISKEKMKQAEKREVMLEIGMRLSSYPIMAGHVVWVEDVSKLKNAEHSLRELNESLEDENELLKEEYRIAKHCAEVEEKQKIYNAIQQETATQIAALCGVLEQVEREEDRAQQTIFLQRAAVLGAYIKRRSNLLLNNAKTPWMPPEEITFTFRDTIESLTLCGVSAGIVVQMNTQIAGNDIKRMYDLFEQIVEDSLEKMTVIHAWVKEEKSWLSFRVQTDAKVDLWSYRSNEVKVVQDGDGEWSITLMLSKGVR